MADDEWTASLRDHPIFSLPESLGSSTRGPLNPLELSTNTLPKFIEKDPNVDSPIPSGRRQTMVLKDADLIVAAGKEIRMSPFGDLKLSQSARKSYKTLRTPNMQFEIHQIALNPTGKLLAIAGAFQVAVVVLPRAGYTRLVPDVIECKHVLAVSIGQYYHATNTAAAIAKIDWHPWGEAGSTLLVMTVDGKLREYDISSDTEEPQQVLNFVNERRSKSFMAEDDSEREVASFTLGKGRADWGPLTVYALMKSGDIYSICPYLPQNASVPPSYLQSLECFISAKQQFLAQESTATSKNLSALYDYQKKYVTGLLKQLPSDSQAAPSTSVSLHPPIIIKSRPSRQGPFLLQPAPRLLEGSEGGDATDIVYMSFGANDDEPDDGARDTEHLGILLISYQDGKVDLFLDVEKVEARWDSKQFSNRGLPMLAVYETIDLGLVSTLNKLPSDPGSTPLLELLRANHPVLSFDPLHDETVYVYHAFGVHALDIGPVLAGLTMALRKEDDETLLKKNLEENSALTNVQPILNTFSAQRRCSNPVVAVAIPNDVYLTYSIFILTSTMRITSLPLILRSNTESAPAKAVIEDTPSNSSKWLKPVDGPAAYVSILAGEPYAPPTLSTSKLDLPPIPDGTKGKEITLTPITFRYLAKTVATLSTKAQEAHLAYRAAALRVSLQQQELVRISLKAKEMESAIDRIRTASSTKLGDRITNIQAEQKRIIARFDKLLQALMQKSCPELSEHETRWFDELKRIRQEVHGVGRYDEESLTSRTRLLEREHKRIYPNLKALSEKQHNGAVISRGQNLGLSQAYEYGEKSNFDRTRITALEKQLSELALQLDIPLGRPPVSQ
ncbi:hypothetical protein CVT24_008715 [Panaeolus cyanescens]|uniref:Uncharacterized protein n=1 Tax=Panaeolus cyanescens TaxID=181874 RepID=A0A409VKJ7_9AGAR|nr:hypothetical protein CVT24_008715 [Panaeolus cyanescens]